MLLPARTKYFWFYFVLNLLVTTTNKQILSKTTHKSLQRPYLLTSIHAFATCVGCLGLQRLFKRSSHALPMTMSTFEKSRLTLRQHAYLALFSMFYTINIALSNWSLALVSLGINHTIRATAPVLTVIVSILVLKKPLAAYSNSTSLSLLLITLGVVIAMSGASVTTSEPTVSKQFTEKAREHHHFYGVSITLLGAFTAVLKTVITHKLTRSLSLQLSSVELLQILSPYATLQALAFAHLRGELDMYPSWLYSTASVGAGITRTTSVFPNAPDYAFPEREKTFWARYSSTVALWVGNAIVAFFLNIASFEANKHCGPVSMAVVANLKQIIILMFSLFARTGTLSWEQELNSKVVIGTILTVVGGISYAYSTAQDNVERSKSIIPVAMHKR